MAAARRSAPASSSVSAPSPPRRPRARPRTPRGSSPSGLTFKGRWAQRGGDFAARTGSIPEIHAGPARRGVPICMRSVADLLDRYDELLALSCSDAERLRAITAEAGRVILADGQTLIPHAVAVALPGVSHQLRQFHHLREADRRAKVALKEKVRSIRPIERKIEGREDAEATWPEVRAFDRVQRPEGGPPGDGGAWIAAAGAPRH